MTLPTTSAVKVADEAGLVCFDCGTPLDTVCRVAIPVAEGAAATGPLCEPCATQRSGPPPPYRPCEHCSRKVSCARHGRHTFCCGRCWHELRLSDKRAERIPRPCGWCELPMTPRTKGQQAHRGSCERALGKARRAEVAEARHAEAIADIEIRPREQWRFLQAKTDLITSYCPSCKERVVAMSNGTCGWCDTPVRKRRRDSALAGLQVAA